MPKAWTGNVCPQPRDFAAYPSRLKDEPRQGFLSVQFFERGKPLFGYCFSSGDEGLFCDTILPKKPLCPLSEKDVRWQAFIRVPFFYNWTQRAEGQSKRRTVFLYSKIQLRSFAIWILWSARHRLGLVILEEGRESRKEITVILCLFLLFWINRQIKKAPCKGERDTKAQRCILVR